MDWSPCFSHGPSIWWGLALSPGQGPPWEGTVWALVGFFTQLEEPGSWPEKATSLDRSNCLAQCLPRGRTCGREARPSPWSRPSAYSSRVRAELLKAPFLAPKTQPCREHVHTSTTGSARDSGRGGSVWRQCSWAPHVRQPAQGRCAAPLPFTAVLGTGALRGGGRGGSCRVQVRAPVALVPEAKEGYGPPPQKLSGPQATPAPRHFTVTGRATS